MFGIGEYFARREAETALDEGGGLPVIAGNGFDGFRNFNDAYQQHPVPCTSRTVWRHTTDDFFYGEYYLSPTNCPYANFRQGLQAREDKERKRFLGFVSRLPEKMIGRILSPNQRTSEGICSQCLREMQNLGFGDILNQDRQREERDITPSGGTNLTL